MRPIPNTLIAFLILSSQLFGQKPASSAAPSWIIGTIAGNALDPKLLNDTKDGYIHLVLEEQVNLDTRTSYQRTVIRIVTEAGIQNGSEISVNYDPTYQRLLFHKICIIRDGRVIDKLDLSKIKTVREEKELDRSIYNGSVTAILFLEDVRKGDQIEYAYSVQGFNPVFGNRYSTSLQTQFEAPVGRILYRIICPSGRNLTIKPKRMAANPVVTTTGSNKVYQWEFTNIEALQIQDDLPSWFDPFPSIEISEFASWNDISKWALPLFTSNHGLSSGLKKKIAEIKAGSGGDDEKKVLATLRFVQDEVRYMGIEMGVNSHKPNDPDKIFHQRFGDCKDKSFLLCTMLKAMNIDAAPVLINTTDKQELQNVLPSPVAFDHCTVRVRLGSRNYWFDPTISMQRGGIAAIAYPDYKCGLVLTDTTTGLTQIPLQEPGQVVAKERFTVPDTYGSAKMEVIVTYSGSFADNIRHVMNNNSLSDMQRNYLNFYNNFYEGMKVADSLRVEDNDSTGKVTTHQYYSIDKLWELEKGIKKASFEALRINSLMERPGERDRTMPIGLNYPVRYTEDIEVRVPEDWNFDHSSPTEIRSPAFTYSSTVNATERTVNIIYKYETLKDHVPVEESGSFLKDYEKMKGDLGYVLTDKVGVGAPSGGGARGLGMGNLAKSLLCLVLLAVIFYFVRRR